MMKEKLFEQILNENWGEEPDYSAEQWKNVKTNRERFIALAKKAKEDHPEIAQYIRDYCMWNFSGDPSSYTDQYFLDMIFDEAESLKDIREREKKAQASKERRNIWTDQYNASYGATPEMVEWRKKAKSMERKILDVEDEIKKSQSYLKYLEQEVEAYWEKAGGREFWDNYKVPKTPKDFN